MPFLGLIYGGYLQWIGSWHGRWIQGNFGIPNHQLASPGGVRTSRISAWLVPVRRAQASTLEVLQVPWCQFFSIVNRWGLGVHPTIVTRDCVDCLWIQTITNRYANMAMENDGRWTIYIVDFPVTSPIHRGFSSQPGFITREYSSLISQYHPLYIHYQPLLYKHYIKNY